MSPATVFGLSGEVMGRWIVLAAAAVMLCACGPSNDRLTDIASDAASGAEDAAQSAKAAAEAAQSDVDDLTEKVEALEGEKDDLEGRIADLESRLGM